MYNPLFDLSILIERVWPSFSLLLKHDFFIAFIGAFAGALGAALAIYYLNKRDIARDEHKKLSYSLAMLVSLLNKMAHFKVYSIGPAKRELNYIKALITHKAKNPEVPFDGKGLNVEGLVFEGGSLIPQVIGANMEPAQYDFSDVYKNIGGWAGVDLRIAQHLFYLQSYMKHQERLINDWNKFMSENRQNLAVDMAFFVGLEARNGVQTDKIGDLLVNIEFSTQVLLYNLDRLTMDLKQVAKEILPSSLNSRFDKVQRAKGGTVEAIIPNEDPIKSEKP